MSRMGRPYHHIPRAPRRWPASVILAAALLSSAAPPLAAHGASSGDQAVVSEAVALKHLQAADIVALFGREERPHTGAHLPRAAHMDSPGALLPIGIEAVMRGGDASTVILVGAETRFPELEECLAMLDVPAQQVSPVRRKLVLTLTHADPQRMRSAIRALPGGGSVSTNGRKLTLEGPEEWLHRALRQVIRTELNLNPKPERPAL